MDTEQTKEVEEEPSVERESIEVVTRNDWGAEPPVSPKRMEPPVKHVFYSETDTLECKTKEQCISMVKGIQKFHMEYRGLSDIQYHFLIGGDGNIYEGRSWYTTSIDYPKENCRIPSELSGKCLEIAFIGCFKEKEPTNEMKVAVNSLVYYGVQNKLVEESHEENSDTALEQLKEESKPNSTPQSQADSTSISNPNAERKESDTAQ